ncbi:unnamed protein product [Protopolystoma xenopodis]|uniref:Uncharacterized protein n=1 Tax=Protopolystoma xenopodis TaxID=117903 RepID=A0A448XEV2_9PLAT|nr:unnamed protein product [Protopolystoma xenopodis]
MLHTCQISVGSRKRVNAGAHAAKCTEMRTLGGGQIRGCRKTDRPTDRPTDRLTDRQTDGPTDRVSVCCGHATGTGRFGPPLAHTFGSVNRETETQTAGPSGRRAVGLSGSRADRECQLNRYIEAFAYKSRFESPRDSTVGRRGRYRLKVCWKANFVIQSCNPTRRHKMQYQQQLIVWLVCLLGAGAPAIGQDGWNAFSGLDYPDAVTSTSLRYQASSDAWRQQGAEAMDAGVAGDEFAVKMQRRGLPTDWRESSQTDAMKRDADGIEARRQQRKLRAIQRFLATQSVTEEANNAKLLSRPASRRGFDGMPKFLKEEIKQKVDNINQRFMQNENYSPEVETNLLPLETSKF